MGDVLVNQLLDVMEDLEVASMGIDCHGRKDLIGACGVDSCRLGVEDKRHGEETFDPFDQLVTAVGLEGVFDPIAGGHAGCDK